MIVETFHSKTAKKFLEKLDPSHELWAKDKWSHTWIFRGQRDATWRLVSSALRTDKEGVHEHVQLTRKKGIGIATDILRTIPTNPAISKYKHNHLVEHQAQIYAEITNLREFYKLANNVILGSSLPLPSKYEVYGTDFADEYLKNIDDQEYMTFMWGRDSVAVAQHHGIATRLVDWTRNPLYAAFFASEGKHNPKSQIAVYAVDTNHLKKSDIKMVEVDNSQSHYIFFQKGIFTLDTKADSIYLDKGKWRDLRDISTLPMYCFTLPATQVPELLRLLWHKNITKAHMMPTLDNVMNALYTKWKLQL